MRLELEASAESTGAPPQITQVKLGVVVENDLVLECSLDVGTRLQPHAIEHRIDGLERLHLHLKAEPHLERAVAAARFFQRDFVVLVYAEINLRERDVLLRVEIIGEILISQHLLSEHNPLPGIDAAELAAGQRPAARDDRPGALIFEQNQILIAKGEQPLLGPEILQHHVRLAVVAEAKRFERRGSFLENARVGIVGRVELVNDVDGLGRHSQLMGLTVASAGATVLALILAHDLWEHSRSDEEREQVVLFIERLAKKLPQLGVNRLWIIVAQKAERRINLILEHHAIDLGKSRQHFDQQWQQVRPFADGPRFAHRAPRQFPRAAAKPVTERRQTADAVTDFVEKGRFAHRVGEAAP